MQRFVLERLKLLLKKEQYFYKKNLSITPFISPKTFIQSHITLNYNSKLFLL